MRDVVRANLLTRFNALLGLLLVVVLIVGPIQDALFGLILIANAAIGIVQELRAKSTLDRLAIVSGHDAAVLRDGREVHLDSADLVLDDLVLARAGDEIVVDGVLESEDPIEVNEALINGEASSVAKRAGEAILAGSFVVAGSGLFRATAVGEARYASRLTIEARRFQLVRSELMRGIDRILRVVTWVIAPTGVLLVISQLRSNPSLADAVRGSVAGVITLVPEGLVLLTSAALALAVIRLGRHRVVIQQLAAVEMLARTDVLCMDKTGTLTDPRMSVSGVRPIAAGDDWRAALGAMSRVDPNPNPSMVALAEFVPDPRWSLEQWIPFSSERKWSAAKFSGHGWWLAGAPDALDASAAGEDHGRAVLLARAESVDRTGGFDGLRPVAIAELDETVKPSVRRTVELLAMQGVTIKVLSGDHPRSVERIAREAGIASPVTLHGDSLPTSEAELSALTDSVSIFGRLTPEQKRSVIRSLKAKGHTVAMVGDGVNDVLALKEADLGIAMGGGSSAARAVAACVLTDGSFDAMPAILAEGRRVIGNVERLASLFFTKTVYAFFLAVAVVVATLPFPFLPRQLTLVSAFTIGIPSVFLALAPTFEPSQSGFLLRVLRFSIPAGVVAGAATFAAYVLALSDPMLAVEEERTVATLVVAAIGLWVLARLAQPWTPRRILLLGAMSLGLLLTLLLPQARDLFAIDLPRPVVLVAAAGLLAMALAALELTVRAVDLVWRRRSA